MKKSKKITVGECFTLYIDNLLQFRNQSGLINCSTIWPDKLRKRKVIANISQKNNMQIIFNYVLFTKGINYQKSYKQIIYLEKTKCNYGGYRYWFLCPNCNTKIGVIYIPPGKQYLACRECHGLTYKSRQLHRNKNYENSRFQNKMLMVNEKLKELAIKN